MDPVWRSKSSKKRQQSRKQGIRQGKTKYSYYREREQRKGRGEMEREKNYKSRAQRERPGTTVMNAACQPLDKISSLDLRRLTSYSMLFREILKKIPEIRKPQCVLWL